MPSSWVDRAALFLCAALAAACVARPETGVALQNVDADIVFGAVPEAAAPPNAGATPEASDAPPIAAPDLGEVVFDDKGFLAFLPPSAVPPPPPCPDAALTEFADVEAPLNVSNRPAAGVYRWKREGTQELAATPGFKLPIGGFEKRIVRSVEEIGDTEFRFDVVQTELNSSDIVVTTYLVRTAAPQQEAPSTDVRAGSLDRGLSIERITRLDGNTGAQRAVAAFEPAVLLLPLPIQQGERVQSVGVDPTTLATLRIDATVTSRKQVDACGEIVDGWSVEGTRTFSANGETTQATFAVVIATQLGAMPIRDMVDVQTTQVRSQVTFTLGQVTPDPLPEDPG